MSPRVVVVVPTRQREHYLRLAVDSVLAQTMTDLRLVVLDNASSDGTSELLASYDDPRLEHVRHPADVGLLGNHNAALEVAEASGAPYALVLSDDDVLRPQHLERTAARLDAHPDVGLVHTRFDMVDGDGEVLVPDAHWTVDLTADAVETGPQFLAASMSWSCRVCSSTALLRTSALSGQRFREADFPPIDFGLWLRLSLGWSVAFVDETLASYRIHAASHSASLGAATSGGYLQDTSMVDAVHRLKLEHLATHPELPDGSGLHRRARTARRRGSPLMARAATLPGRRPGPTLRAVREAAAVDRGVLRLPGTWSLVVAALLGPRLRALASGSGRAETPGRSSRTMSG